MIMASILLRQWIANPWGGIMNSSPGNVVNLALDFPERSKSRDLLRRLAAQSGVDVNIVRGRLTENEARYEIQLKGLRAGVEKSLRLLTGPGVTCRVVASKPVPGSWIGA